MSQRNKRKGKRNKKGGNGGASGKQPAAPPEPLTLGAAAGERRSDAAVTGREATSVAYSHASCTCRASCSALSTTTLPSTHWPSSSQGSLSLHAEELTLEPTLGRSPPPYRGSNSAASLGMCCCRGGCGGGRGWLSDPRVLERLAACSAARLQHG